MTELESKLLNINYKVGTQNIEIALIWYKKDKL